MTFSEVLSNAQSLLDSGLGQIAMIPIAIFAALAVVKGLVAVFRK